MKCEVPSSYGQIYLWATNIEDFPDWDDESLKRGFVYTKEGIYLLTENDQDIQVSFQDDFCSSKFHHIARIALASPNGKYEISSPDYTGDGIIISVDGDSLELNIWVDSLDMHTIRSVVFVTSAVIKLSRTNFFEPQ